MENLNYEILHQSMWNMYDEIKKSNFQMDGMEDSKRVEILEFYLLPYFVKYEEYEIANELKKQILAIRKSH
jgi:hypothetical protein